MRAGGDVKVEKTEPITVRPLSFLSAIFIMLQCVAADVLTEYKSHLMASPIGNSVIVSSMTN